MPTHESSVVIAAPRETVWRILSHIAAWPEWLPTVVKVEPLNENSLCLGSRFVTHQPKLRPPVWTVSEIERPKRFVWVARLPGVEMLAEHAIAQKSSASSGVTLRLSFARLLGGIIGKLFRSVTESYLAQEAASLERAAEASR
jgi:uncharacterized membrane protein